MEERREKDRPGVSPTLRHVLSPQIPSRPTSHPSPLTPPLLSHSGLLGFSFCWQSVPLHLLSHSTGPHASTKPVARNEDGISEVCVTLCVAPPFALLAIRLHPMPYRVPMPPSYSLSHPTFNRTPACTLWLFSTDACFMTLRGTMKWLMEKEEGKVCSVASRTTSGHLGWSFSCS
ncbi:hypothetical protein BT69DRAFT_1276070 [Atractiella rhizophila]|nr:hypothetical protein BT69DRAFT_1276070 [Atractiella rhizophila]